MKMVIYMVALWLLGIAIVSSMSLYRVMHHEEVTVERSPKLYCYTAFDVYVTDNYEITDDNRTVITSYGRVYHVEDCNRGLLK